MHLFQGSSANNLNNQTSQSGNNPFNNQNPNNLTQFNRPIQTSSVPGQQNFSMSISSKTPSVLNSSLNQNISNSSGTKPLVSAPQINYNSQNNVSENPFIREKLGAHLKTNSISFGFSRPGCDSNSNQTNTFVSSNFGGQNGTNQFNNAPKPNINYTNTNTNFLKTRENVALIGYSLDQIYTYSNNTLMNNNSNKIEGLKAIKELSETLGKQIDELIEDEKKKSTLKTITCFCGKFSHFSDSNSDSPPFFCSESCFYSSKK